MADEVLKRLGKSWESFGRLARKAEEAEQVIGIHGVSVTAAESLLDHSYAPRELVESVFAVHDTETRRDPLHRTIELPKPVTAEVAEVFNRLFGRER